jgi:ADP-heptose:LPS heptosyltransferase
MNRLKPVEHKFKALFFSFFKRLLKKGRQEFQPLDGRTLKKVLFLRPEKIGDMVISLPVFDGLKKHFPHVQISILASPKNYALIKEDPRFDKIYLYRKVFWQDVKVLWAMRKEKFDCVIDMICNDSVTALFLSQLIARGRPRIGVGKVKYRDYYDFNYDHRMNNTGHIIDNTLKLLTAFGIDTETISGYGPPFLDKNSLKKAERFINEVTNHGHNALKIGYNLSAGSPTRLWSDQKCLRLLERILNYNGDCQVILFMTPEDRPRGERLCQQFHERLHLIPNGLNLTEVSALIKKIDVMITPDTSLVHIARAFRVPVVGLYSRFRKNFLLWRPYGQEIGAVVSNHDDNIFDIAVDEVFATFVSVTRQMIPVVR